MQNPTERRMTRSMASSTSQTLSGFSIHEPVRYLNVMTTRSSHAKSLKPPGTHSKLLIEPVVMPNLTHINVEPQHEAKQTCLFYPTGERNTNLRREIQEKTMMNNKLLEQEIRSPKLKNKYRKVKEDPYGNPYRGDPLYYTKSRDKSAEAIIQNVRTHTWKIDSTVNMRLWKKNI